MESCNKRHSLTQHLLQSLQLELKYPEASMIDVADDSSSQARLTLESVSEWAADRYGIGIPEWAPEVTDSDIDLTDVVWEDVTIKLYKNNRIAYSFGDGNFRESTFAKIGLVDKRKNKPNQLAGILIGLSQHQKYPPKIRARSNEKTAISKLGRKLKKMTGLSGSPFRRINPTDGWKPRFELIDDRKNADERVKERAIHVHIDDPNNHELGKHIAQKYFENEAVSDSEEL